MPNKMKFSTFSHAGRHVYLVSDVQVSITRGDRCWLSIIAVGNQSKVYRIPDHANIGNPLMVIDKPLTEMSKGDIVSIIMNASQ